MSDTCFLYVIGIEGETTPVKIGVAKNTKVRLAQLQTGNPQQLEVKAQYEARSRTEAQVWESNAHDIFADKRLSGEWFSITADDVEGEDWATDKRLKKSEAATPIARPAITNFEPNHPYVPSCLRNRSPEQMSPEERLEFWACFGLPAPPDGFDDWYLVGSPSSGILGAFPVEGFMNGVHDE